MLSDFKNFPDNPGCYLYKDGTGKIIYVGKAKSLKKRVSSYFTKNEHDAKTSAMLRSVESADYIVTNNEVEALILESSLIKKHRPKFNINLKDSKRYAYLRLTDEKYPRLVISRHKKGKIFGPFVSAQDRNAILSSLKKIFKIRTCKRLPKKACLRFHMSLCDAPCIGGVDEDIYREKTKKISNILNGKIDGVLKELKDEMNAASERLFFETAIEKRNQIAALENLKEHQNMERKKLYDEDVINYIVRDNYVYLLIFKVLRGTLNKKIEFVFEYKEDFLREFIVQFYDEKKIPKELIIPKSIDPAVSDFLKKKSGKNVKIFVPERGEKRQLLELAKKNAEITFFGHIEKVNSLKERLKLKSSPENIEIFDVSHLSGTSTVASMVQFKQGAPNKTNYRRFKIKTVDGVDDYLAIGEAVRRRYSRLKEENKQYPDLIIRDGGKGQLKSAKDQMDLLGLNIPLISIAKGNEEIYFPNSRFPLKLEKRDTALKFVQEMRDEAHRFAINYNRLLRKKRLRGK